MAWKLRQPFEGDRIITVSDVSDSAECWVDGSGNYVPDSIAVKINGTEHILNTVTNLDLGFLGFPVPTGVYITGTTTVEVYAVCETDPESHTDILTAKPVNFQVNNGVIKACNSQVILNSDLDEYIRLFFTGASGDYFTASWNSNPLTIDDFDYQAGDTGNIESTSGGLFSRPATLANTATLISKTLYTGNITLRVIPASTTKYFTARLGYIELIFDNGNLLYNNYMVSSEFEVASGTYATNDQLTIEATNSSYTVRKNGTVLFTKNKNISYTVSAGTVVPSSSQIGVPVVWNVPSSAGNYTFTGTLGDAVVFQKQVTLHSCADAKDDSFVGTYNTPYNGDVSINDVGCVGENTYFELASSPAVVGGSVVVNQNGSFTFTPSANYNSVATFSYNIKCGASAGVAEIVDTAVVSINYFNPCSGVTENWVDTGNTRCQNCTEEKEQTDTNAQCTGNSNRWVVNPGGSQCNSLPNPVPTGQTRCENCINEREVQDLNPCSSTYQVKSWQFNPSGNNCDSIPVWVDNGQLRCNACAEEKQQQDTKPCSPSFGQTRWVANPGGTQCNRFAVWVDISEYVCVSCQEYKKQRDSNSCSPTYNTTRNIPNPGGTACNTDPTWVDSGQTRCNLGVHEKEQISNNPCSTEQTRWVPSGLQLCGCIKQRRFFNNCDPGDEIVGVTVTKQGVAEGNRLISYDNSVITFSTEIGTFTYVAIIKYASGIERKITELNVTCNPII